LEGCVAREAIFPYIN